MRTTDLHKNPLFYYILVPIATALWPLLLWGVWLPGSQRGFDEDRKNYTKAGKTVLELLELDPGRLDAAETLEKAGEFDYTKAINNAAQLCGIPADKYKLSSGIVVKSGGQKTQNAKVSLDDIDIVRFARFLSAVQLRWANLQCTQVRLTKKKEGPDVWDFDLQFKYYYAL